MQLQPSYLHSNCRCELEHVSIRDVVMLLCNPLQELHPTLKACRKSQQRLKTSLSLQSISYYM